MPVFCGELSRRRLGASASPAPTGLGVGSFQFQRRDESSKQEMVTRRRERLNDLQLSSQKEKKKKSNNRQIVAGLPEGEVSEVVLGAGHQLAEGLLCPREVSPHRLSIE